MSPCKFILLFILSFCFFSEAAQSQSRHFPRGSHAVQITNASGVRGDLLQNIEPILEKSIAAGSYPGAVILVGHHGKIIYRGVFGNRRILPNIAPMQFNTMFDLASLTKVVATTPAIMQLVEQGKIDLDARVAHYWPAFAKNGKQAITIRELLTHTSGLPAEIPLPSAKINRPELFAELCALNLTQQPGTHFLYSDVNFIVLAQLVEIISHESFANYVNRHLFQPLQMRNTFFNPAIALRDRIAPTELVDNHLRWGAVQDPIAAALGGVSGNAGVFSNANDLGLYAQALLDGGVLPLHAHGNSQTIKHFLGPLTIAKMTSVQTPASISDTRGLGWDIDSRYSNRGVLMPTHSFGHTGWTGTSLWIDPVTQTWIVILTSRTHPTTANDHQLIRDRRTIATIISASIVDISLLGLNNTGRGELARAFHTSNPF